MLAAPPPSPSRTAARSPAWNAGVAPIACLGPQPCARVPPAVRRMRAAKAHQLSSQGVLPEGAPARPREHRAASGYSGISRNMLHTRVAPVRRNGPSAGDLAPLLGLRPSRPARSGSADDPGRSRTIFPLRGRPRLWRVPDGPDDADDPFPLERQKGGKRGVGEQRKSILSERGENCVRAVQCVRNPHKSANRGGRSRTMSDDAPPASAPACVRWGRGAPVGSAGPRAARHSCPTRAAPARQGAAQTCHVPA